MLYDLWAHRHVDDPNLRNEFIAEGLEEDLAEMEAESLRLEEKHRAREEAKDDPDDWEEI